MSKSAGNVVDPSLLCDRYGPSAVRYYLLRDIATGQDADFSPERLELRYTTDLANGLGNLLNRTLNMAARYRQGVLCKPSQSGRLAGAAREALAAYDRAMEEFQIHDGLAAAWGLVDAANGFVEETAPWKLAKDPGQAGVLDAVLYDLAESLRLLSIMVAPVMPDAARSMRQQLGIAGAATWADAEWGGLAEGHALGEATPLFPRLEPPPKE